MASFRSALLQSVALYHVLLFARATFAWILHLIAVAVVTRQLDSAYQRGGHKYAGVLADVVKSLKPAVRPRRRSMLKILRRVLK